MTSAIDRLVTDSARLSADRRGTPAATYRIQMHRGFPFQKVAEITDYLHALGISHVYTSSLLTAKSCSNHGYDVTDHSRINPEIGTEQEFSAWVAGLRERKMGVILDVVPNHMSVSGENAWWADVLEHGPSSPYARYFDIAWANHFRQQLHGKVLLPILGESYGKAVDGGQFRPVYAGGAVWIELNGRRLPTDPRTWDAVLAPAVDGARAVTGQDTEGVLELQSILTAVRNLPSRNETDPEKVVIRRAEVAVIKRRLAELDRRYPTAAEEIRKAVAVLAGVPGDPAGMTGLDQFLDAQAYRACDWRVASDEINYRRFFDVNDLAALNTERPEVFEDVHRLIFEWLGRGLIDGLRIDHIDGLYDPRQYLDRLQTKYLTSTAKRLLAERPDDYPGLTWAEAEPVVASQTVSGRPLFVVVEKILTGDETAPEDWATEGTSGYEFLNAVNGLFVDPAGETEITRIYEAFTGIDDSVDEIVYRKKFLVLQSSLTGELHTLSHQLDSLAQAERWSRDFTLNGLRHALREVIACFPVYRSYVDGVVKSSDRISIQRAVRRARTRNPLLGRAVFDFIRDTLLLRDPPSGPASDEYRAAQQQFVGKFQQLTPPVMAKGCEDTSFYVYNRLISLNEVGGDPARFGWAPDRVHQFLGERAEKSPGGLSPLATHDTKRGEDVRARLNVLSERPAEWGRRLAKWRELNRVHKVDLGDELLAPDPNEEYLIYQTLIGTRPLASDDDVGYVARIAAYMNKAVLEAKVHSSWINPEPEYLDAVKRFVEAILDPAQSGEFLAELDAFVAIIARYGMVNSLAQTLVRCTGPGVPDFFQGTELWDLSLVDPDNRRPVDFSIRAEWLRSLDIGRVDLADLVANMADGRIKLFLISRALRARRDNASLFAAGKYVPLTVIGAKANHVFAFLRVHDSASALVVVPRLLGGLNSGDSSLSESSIWGDTAIVLPPEMARYRWTNVFTDELILPTPSFSIDQILHVLPVALLTTRNNQM